MKKSLLVATLCASQLVVASVSAEEAKTSEMPGTSTQMLSGTNTGEKQKVKVDETKRKELLKLIDKSKLTDKQKEDLAVEVSMAETQEDLDKVAKKFKELTEPKETTAAPTETTQAPTETTAAPAETTQAPAETSAAKTVEPAKRTELLKAIDAADLKEEEKGKLAEEANMAETPEALEKVAAKLKAMMVPKDTTTQMPKETTKAMVDSAKRTELLKAIDASNLKEEEKGKLAEEANMAETSEALEKVAAKLKAMMAPKDTPKAKADSAKRTELLKAIDASNLTAEQKGKLAEKATMAETQEDLDKVAAEFKAMQAPSEKPKPGMKSDAALRDELLKLIDNSNLTAEQKGKLAEEVSFAKDRTELEKVAAKVRKMIAEKPADKKPDDKKEADKKAIAKPTKKPALPNTGEKTSIVGLITAVLAIVAGALLIAPRFKKEK
ncbi:LPXTG cell wall anchor domain-containing protein [Tuanshanicoccus lijuaniae]|uniref:LPXTG cell wall anchor domain-containing protein n=1 Tax=Aerococcaceae bacterium zg-1292 TaxID=2774330 RepID=UPI001BD8CF35|nr:LPXTG cell wall anchor domain-containing protein [Aerococcaceae bacterium zg-A91]MBS4458374.1 LPXTG cell wall anchor domain-containing protein [Aerococcaceae bacterium zg-BR33]